MDWELQNRFEKDDISRVKALMVQYRILQAENLENLAKMKLAYPINPANLK